MTPRLPNGNMWWGIAGLIIAAVLLTLALAGCAPQGSTVALWPDPDPGWAIYEQEIPPQSALVAQCGWLTDDGSHWRLMRDGKGLAGTNRTDEPRTGRFAEQTRGAVSAPICEDITLSIEDYDDLDKLNAALEKAKDRLIKRLAR